jgi:KDO2-lipid IV(A) lauroyltransferase
MQSHLPRASRFADRFHRWAMRRGFPALLHLAPRWPRWLERACARWVIWAVFAAYPGPKPLIRRNLARILGRSPRSWRVRRTAARMLRNFGIYHVDMYRFSQLPPAAGLACVDVITGLEHLERAAADGRGAVMLTAHFGNYEMGGVLLGRKDLPVSVVYVRDKFEVAESFRSEVRRRGGVEEIPVAPHGSWSSLPVLRALRGGRLVAMQGDRDFDGKGIAATFFGAPVLFPRGPFLVAMLTGAPVIAVFIGYTSSYRFEGRIHPPFVVEQTGDRERDLESAVRRWAALLEEEVRRDPAQWYTFYDWFAQHRVEVVGQPVPTSPPPPALPVPERAGRASA